MHVTSPALRKRMQASPVAPWLRGWPLAFGALCVAPLLVLLALPWPLEGKALAALHGLCAQQPTHSLYFDGRRLPFGARMTGIYSGFLTTALFLATRGRWRAGELPTRGALAALLGGVVAMGLDGLNSTLLDAGLWHAYAPRNDLRLATGLLAGAALGVFIWLTLAQVALAPSPAKRRRVLRGGRELAALLAVEAAVGALIASQWTPLWAPLTLALLGAAVAVVTALTLPFTLLLTRRECRARTARQLAGPATAALTIAYLFLAVSAGGRFLLEALAHLPAARGG